MFPRSLTVPQRAWHPFFNLRLAGVAELADAPDSKSGGRKAVWVRVPPPVLKLDVGVPADLKIETSKQSAAMPAWKSSCLVRAMPSASWRCVIHNAEIVLLRECQFLFNFIAGPYTSFHAAFVHRSFARVQRYRDRVHPKCRFREFKIRWPQGKQGSDAGSGASTVRVDGPVEKATGRRPQRAALRCP